MNIASFTKFMGLSIKAKLIRTREGGGVMENWYALCIAILTEKTPDEALQVYGIIRNERIENNQRIYCTDNLLKEMYQMKLEGYTNKQIGERFSLGAEAVRLKIYRYKLKLVV